MPSPLARDIQTGLKPFLGVEKDGVTRAKRAAMLITVG
jgi:hypothetical protein